MKSFTVSIATVLLVASASAQDSTATTTIIVKPGCPSAAPADVIVTRSPVAVPSCAAAANETKPVIISMSTMAMGSGTGSGMASGRASGMASGLASGMASGTAGASATKTGGPAQFTGAADNTRVGGVMVLVGGIVAGLLL